MKRPSRKETNLLQILLSAFFLFLAVTLQLFFKNENDSDHKLFLDTATLSYIFFALSYLFSALVLLKRTFYSLILKKINLEFLIALSSVGLLFYKQYSAACLQVLFYAVFLFVLKKITGIEEDDLLGKSDFSGKENLNVENQSEENQSGQNQSGQNQSDGKNNFFKIAMPQIKELVFTKDDEKFFRLASNFILKYFWISCILCLGLAILPPVALGGGSVLLKKWIFHALEFLLLANPAVFYFSFTLILFCGKEKSFAVKKNIFLFTSIFALLIKLLFVILTSLEILNIFYAIAIDAFTMAAGILFPLILLKSNSDKAEKSKKSSLKSM